MTPVLPYTPTYSFTVYIHKPEWDTYQQNRRSNSDMRRLDVLQHAVGNQNKTWGFFEIWKALFAARFLDPLSEW